jgi:type II secretory pathway pseudopilin PulG
MSVKKKNGFTLIELLVTIAIMISILTIAIVSITRISDGIKQQSYESVKDQVITAAEEYLSTNSYYIDTINGGSSIEISVGELVSNDYLNVVTNPVTGEKIDECSYVLVELASNDNETINSKGLKYTFNEEGSCPAKEYVTVKPGIVIGNLTVEPFGTKLENNDWYKINDNYDENAISEGVNNDNFEKVSQGVVVRLTATVSNNNYYISSIKVSSDTKLDVESEWTDLYNVYADSSNSDDPNTVIAYDTDSYSSTTPTTPNDEGKNTTYKVVYSDYEDPESTVEITQTVKYKVDVTPPSCKTAILGVKKNGEYICYTPLNISIIGKCLTCFCPSISFQTSDEGSGINKDADKKFFSGISGTLVPPTIREVYNIDNNINDTISDMAGNEGSCNFNGEFDVIDPVGDIINDLEDYVSNLEVCGETTGNENWTRSCRTIKQTYKKISGTETETQEVGNVCNEGTITIKSSNGTSCTVNTNIDKTPPTLSNPSTGLSSSERAITFTQKNNAGAVVKSNTITVNKTGNTYNADICLVNVSGSFQINIKNPSVTDSGSGVNTNSWKTTASMTNKNGKSINGCLRTRGDNPCTYTFKKYVSDKVGNQALVATYVFRIGYINNGVSGGTYDSFCN